MTGESVAHGVVLSLVLGCTLDTSGIGQASGLSTVGVGSETTVADGSSEAGGESSSTGGASGSGGSTSDSAATASTGSADEQGSDEVGSSSDDGGEASTTSVEVDPCSLDPAFSVSFEADMTTLAGTMMLGMGGDGQPYAYSADAETGSATVTFASECADEYAIWAFVYDGDPLLNTPFDNSTADRMRVTVDGGDTDWRYGCQTGLDPWSWQAVGTNNVICTNDNLAVYSLPPGEHTVAFTPTEAGTPGADSPGSAAALMRLIITNDLDFMP
ncbi:MAG: hypothetical protein IAG13_00870 [Deltaproteobacteria bacterium]|nr:hypothetical protein [Nannocystaceae bacterium]